MKFIHTADIHLGAEPEKGFLWAEDRGKEIWKTFSNLIDQTEKEHADFLFIAGDLFHRQPLLRELKEVNYLFSSLSKTKVVLIAGNHDYIKSDSYYKSFVWNENVIFLKSDKIGKVIFPDIRVEVYGGSYYERENKERWYETILPERQDFINVLMIHGGDENHCPYSIEKLKSLGFDYIALGHIHKPEILVPNRIIQAGSLEPLDCTELGSRGYFIGELTKQGASVHFVPFARRRYISIQIPVTIEDTVLSVQKRIQERMNIEGLDNIYKILLEGYRDEVIHFPEESFLRLGNICQFEDKTSPDYDLDAMYKVNSDNILGWYMNEFMKKEKLDDTEKKALYYGIRALTLGE